jgi:hypothetical protein
VKPESTPQLLLPKQTWRDSVATDMLLSAVSVLVVALPSSELQVGFTNDPVCVLGNLLTSVASTLISLLAENNLFMTSQQPETEKTGDTKVFCKLNKRLEIITVEIQVIPVSQLL